jgi:hypothetical protein
MFYSCKRIFCEPTNFENFQLVEEKITCQSPFSKYCEHARRDLFVVSYRVILVIVFASQPNNGRCWKKFAYYGDDFMRQLVYPFKDFIF